MSPSQRNVRADHALSARRGPALAAGVAFACLFAAGFVTGVRPADAARPPAARVVGGSPTSVSQNPWMVFLASPELYPGAPSNQFCGGTLVAPRKVITAAHCVADKNRTALEVIAGRNDLRSRDGITERIADVWVSPQYGGPNGPGDVAVLTLGGALPYQTMRVIGAGQGVTYRTGAIAAIYGWGAQRENGGPSDQLRHASVPLVSDQSCAASYGRQYVSTAMVCAGYPGGGVDTCQGDSGGPLLLADGVTGRQELAGIVSWGQGCAEPGYPGVYTRLATYMSEVRQHLGR